MQAVGFVYAINTTCQVSRDMFRKQSLIGHVPNFFGSSLQPTNTLAASATASLHLKPWPSGQGTADTPSSRLQPGVAYKQGLKTLQFPRVTAVTWRSRVWPAPQKELCLLLPLCSTYCPVSCLASGALAAQPSAVSTWHTRALQLNHSGGMPSVLVTPT